MGITFGSLAGIALCFLICYCCLKANRDDDEDEKEYGNKTRARNDLEMDYVNG